ncbi:MAG TPA: hypothetical protein DCL32_03545, partial [Gammaproteobacteria bacterium]|nr:hypothetical protein [Gammaproteobacteria bacterium]
MLAEVLQEKGFTHFGAIRRKICQQEIAAQGRSIADTGTKGSSALCVDHHKTRIRIQNRPLPNRIAF